MINKFWYFVLGVLILLLPLPIMKYLNGAMVLIVGVIFGMLSALAFSKGF